MLPVTSTKTKPNNIRRRMACSPARGTGYRATRFILSLRSDLSHLLSFSTRDSFDGGPKQHLYHVFFF